MRNFIARATNILGPVYGFAFALCLSPFVQADADVHRLDIDSRRSLAVTETDILKRFPLERVLEQLVAQADIPDLSSVSLFNQWWDTNNPKPGLGLGPNCDSETNYQNGPSINGFPFDCRPNPIEEGMQAFCDPFSMPECEYFPTGLFMRFDLAPVNGDHCGEYRILYAKRSVGNIRRDRNTLIFEAILPNPKPSQGIKGCRKIVEDWAALSSENDMERRADWLEAFYFDGHGAVAPVVSVTHYGDNALEAGQIRTNQFIQNKEEGRHWSLREFKLKKTCQDDNCKLQMVPVTVKENPFGKLFDPESQDPKAKSFQAAFVQEAVETLAADTLGAISMSLSGEYNAAQSHASGSDDDHYPKNFGVSDAPDGFRAKIQAKLNELDSDLTPDHIVRRAMTQSCAGCHRLNRTRADRNEFFADLGGGLEWPQPLGFTHVDERELEQTIEGKERFKISPFLTDVFLPLRREVMSDYLNFQPGKYKGKTMGGRSTH